VENLEAIYSLVMGIMFLLVGIAAFISNPPKLPWIIRFAIIFIGTGFILYSILNGLGLTELK